jgi:cation:H+ antiporter
MLLDLSYVAVSVLILAKCADWFVEGAVGVAEKLRLPHMLVGLVLVSLATTAPELLTSLLAAMRGMPEAALGNAVGSVVVNAAFALGLAAALSVSPLPADPGVFRSSALVFGVAAGLAFLFSLDGELAQWEGVLLVLVYAAYVAWQYARLRAGRGEAEEGSLPAELEEDLEAVEQDIAGAGWGKTLALFGAGLLGVLLGSRLLLAGAEGIAAAMGMSSVVMGLTVTAIGTSVPEIATAATAALKNRGGIGVGNIIGANILNICWVAGLSAAVNPLAIGQTDVWFMFPAMFLVIGAMLLMLRQDYQLTRGNGVALLASGVAFYVALFVFVV